MIGTHSQFITACAAFIISRLKLIPLGFELGDLWQKSIKKVGALQNSSTLRILECTEMFLYNNADRVVCVRHSFKRTCRRGVLAY